MTAPRTVFLTGGASGIGRATVQRLAVAGDRLVVMDRDADALATLVRDMAARGLSVRAETADVRDRASMVRVLDSEPRIDVAVAVAGVYRSHPFEDLSDEAFRNTLDVNLLGVFAFTQEAAKRMQPGGRIVVVSSRGALGMNRAADYVASKAGVVGLVRAMAMDLRSRQIAVNSVAPGFTDTPMTRSMPKDLYAASAALEPSGGAASPDDIAQAIAFFADGHTRFITGQTLLVDGGKSLGAIGL